MTMCRRATVAERHQSGVLDTCVYIDLDLLEPDALPVVPEITAITMAENTWDNTRLHPAQHKLGPFDPIRAKLKELTAQTAPQRQGSGAISINFAYPSMSAVLSAPPATHRRVNEQ